MEKEKREGKAGRIALALMRMDLAILDELGYLPFSQAGGALLFHLLSKLYEHSRPAVGRHLHLLWCPQSPGKKFSSRSATSFAVSAFP